MSHDTPYYTTHHVFLISKFLCSPLLALGSDEVFTIEDVDYLNSFFGQPVPDFREEGDTRSIGGGCHLVIVMLVL